MFFGGLQRKKGKALGRLGTGGEVAGFSLECVVCGEYGWVVEKGSVFVRYNREEEWGGFLI